MVGVCIFQLDMYVSASVPSIAHWGKLFSKEVFQKQKFKSLAYLVLLTILDYMYVYIIFAYFGERF